MDKESSKQIEMKIFWLKLWGLLKPVHRIIKVLLVLIVFDELLQLAGPYLFKLIIDNLNQHGIARWEFLAGLIIAMLLLDQLVIRIGYWEDKRIFSILVDTEKNLNEMAMGKMVELDLGYHEKNNTGAKISRIHRGIDKVSQLLSDIFWQVAPTLIQVVLTLAILFFVDWRFGLAFLFYVPIFAVMTYRLNKRVFPLRRRRHDQYEAAAGQMAEAIININTVKSFAQEKREVGEFRAINEDIKRNALKEFLLMLRYNYGRSTIINLGRVTMIFFGIFLVAKSAITIGSLVFVITITEKALLSLYRITRLYDRIMESSEAVNRLADLKGRRPEIANPANGYIPKNADGEIVFKKVVFHYAGGNRALDNVSFKIIGGSITALVGPSGGGKSTIARLIFRHYDPQAGSILLDGRDLRDYDLYGLRKLMAIVPQDVEIFDADIKTNIAYAAPAAGTREIEAAAKIANAHGFISRLPKKYASIVGERGIKLSGGQKQRIGIARAVLANPRILVFDEATSHLDSESELLIQESLDKIVKGKTVIIIAHRLSTIMKAHKILVFQEGRLSEQGSHFELMKNSGGIYSRLTKLQNLL